MHKKIISLLRCPYCESSLVVADTFKSANKNQIIYGSVQCDCDTYPIVQGILYLKKGLEPDLKNQRAVEYLKQNQYNKAIEALLDERKRAKIPYQLLIRLHSIIRFSLSSALTLISVCLPESRAWFAYLKKRPLRPTFLLSLTSSAFMKKSGTVVDIGCGLGHFLQQIRNHNLANTYIGLDSQFSLLLLARMFTVDKDITLICADAEMGLPFKNASVEYCTMNDAWMYIRKKKLSLLESVRIIKKDGLSMITHVHTAQGTNIAAGYGIHAKELSRYLQNLTAYICTDSDLFSAMRNHRSLPYQKFTTKTARVVTSINSISLVISPSSRHSLPKTTTPSWVRTYYRKIHDSMDWLEDRF